MNKVLAVIAALHLNLSTHKVSASEESINNDGIIYPLFTKEEFLALQNSGKRIEIPEFSKLTSYQKYCDFMFWKIDPYKELISEKAFDILRDRSYENIMIVDQISYEKYKKSFEKGLDLDEVSED